MNRKLFTLLILVALLLTTLPLAAQDDNTLVMARKSDSTGLDPHTQTAFTSLELLNMVYEPLVTNDHALNLAPALAESWEFSDDAMMLTVYLREGVKFHDGSDLTAEDVIASFERLLDEETASAARTNYVSIESMEAPDDLTVVFNLSTPDVPLLSAMASTNAAILSADVIASGDPAVDVVGTGPFVLDSWVPEEVALLSANADYWGEGPNVDGVEVRIIPDETTILAALRAGELDFAVLKDPLVATLLMGDDAVNLIRTPTLSYHVMQLRAAANDVLGQLAFRQALSCAIDRQEVVDLAALGEGRVTGPLTMASFALPTSDLFCYEKDVEKALELMAEVDMPEDFVLNVMVANAEPPTALSEAQSIQAQLGAIGVTVEIEPLELSVYVDRWLAADFDAAVALNGGRTDPYTMYARYWQEDARFQDVAGYLDETLDTLMKAGQVEPDAEVRYEIFAELQTHLAETVPWVWLYAGYTYSAHQDSVQGWEPVANDSLRFLSEVTLAR